MTVLSLWSHCIGCVVSLCRPLVGGCIRLFRVRTLEKEREREEVRQRGRTEKERGDRYIIKKNAKMERCLIIS